MSLYLFFFFIGLIFSSPDFSKLEKTQFGKTLLNTIQVQLSNSANTDALMQLLDKLRDEMNQQKENHEQDHQQFQSDCAKDIDLYQQEIASAIVKVVDTDREIAITKEDIRIKESLLEQLNIQFGVYSGAHDKLLQNRKEEATEFENKNGEHDQTVTAIEEAKQFFIKRRNEIVNKKKLKPSFLQEKEKEKNKLAEKLNQQKEQIKSLKYAVILTTLNNVAQQDETNPQVIATLLQLCNRVLKNIQDSRMAETEAENKRIKIFTSKMKILDENLGKTSQKITTFENQKNTLGASLQLNQGIQKEQCERRDENKKFMNNREEECKVENKDFEQFRQKMFQFFIDYFSFFGIRLQEIRTVEMVITTVQTSLAVMKEYLRERQMEDGNILNLNIK